MASSLTIALTITGEGTDQIERLQDVLNLLVANDGSQVKVAMANDPDPSESLIGEGPFTHSMLKQFWLGLHGKKAAQFIAILAKKVTSPRSVIMRQLGERNPHAFGGYLSALGYAQAAAKLPARPYEKLPAPDPIYFLKPHVAAVFRQFAEEDGYYHES